MLQFYMLLLVANLNTPEKGSSSQLFETGVWQHSPAVLYNKWMEVYVFAALLVQIRSN